MNTVTCIYISFHYCFYWYFKPKIIKKSLFIKIIFQKISNLYDNKWHYKKSKLRNPIFFLAGCSPTTN